MKKDYLIELLMLRLEELENRKEDLNKFIDKLGNNSEDDIREYLVKIKKIEESIKSTRKTIAKRFAELE